MFRRLFVATLLTTIGCTIVLADPNKTDPGLLQSIRQADRIADTLFRKSQRSDLRRRVRFPEDAYSAFRASPFFQRLQTIEAETSLLYTPRPTADGGYDLFLTLRRKSNPAECFARSDTKQIAHNRSRIEHLRAVRERELADVPEDRRNTTSTFVDQQLAEATAIQIYLENEGAARAREMAEKRAMIQLAFHVPPMLAVHLDGEHFHDGKRRYTVRIETVALSAPETNYDVSPVIHQIEGTVVALDEKAFVAEACVPTMDQVLASLEKTVK